MRILKYTNEAVFLTRLRSLEAIWFGQSLVTIDRVGEGGVAAFQPIVFRQPRFGPAKFSSKPLKIRIGTG
jgi:hypothetical protein